MEEFNNEFMSQSTSLSKETNAKVKTLKGALTLPKITISKTINSLNKKLNSMSLTSKQNQLEELKNLKKSLIKFQTIICKI